MVASRLHTESLKGSSERRRQGASTTNGHPILLIFRCVIARTKSSQTRPVLPEKFPIGMVMAPVNGNDRGVNPDQRWKRKSLRRTRQVNDPFGIRFSFSDVADISLVFKGLSCARAQLDRDFQLSHDHVDSGEIAMAHLSTFKAQLKKKGDTIKPNLKKKGELLAAL